MEQSKGLDIKVQYFSADSDFVFDDAIKELLQEVHKYLNMNEKLSIDAVKHYRDVRTNNNFIEVFLKEQE